MIKPPPELALLIILGITAVNSGISFLLGYNRTRKTRVIATVLFLCAVEVVIGALLFLPHYFFFAIPPVLIFLAVALIFWTVKPITDEDRKGIIKSLEANHEQKD